MKTDEPKKILLREYRAPQFAIPKTELHFDLHEDFCRVHSKLQVQRLTPNDMGDLQLNGEQLELEEVRVNGKVLNKDQYKVDEEHLTLSQMPAQFELQITVKIQPQLNTALEGLYKSGGMFCTQCEPESFRRVTYFLDRPDVMSSFTVHINADKKQYPILLSNGDRTAASDLADGRHQVTYFDPHKKPCYLFALVAGDLGVIKDTYTTASNKRVNLEIYAAHGQQERCWHAMRSLQHSMRWDEQRFGREYDLSTYMIVVADDFNAGAMENKGLNIFNSRLVLADPKSATDDDYFNIESVVAHEYFHNWTGNRVTLRDWFHLSLKEGLTVFRDQEFSADMSSRSVVRIDSVNALRARQFAEDAGPSAHPIRPESCFAVDNFFTATIYEKGAEVIRMMQTMVGRPGFRKGMDLYFSRHDGQAVIIEDFAKAIADANSQSWDQFKLWYSQAGTPEVEVLESFDALKKQYSLTLRQNCPDTPGQTGKKPMHIPLVFALLGEHGNILPIRLEQGKENFSINSEGQQLLHLQKTEQTFVFGDIAKKPTLSLNRDFSAPIKLKWEAGEQQLLSLMQFDGDEFNRWEAGQSLALDHLLKTTEEAANHKVLDEPTALLAGFKQVLVSKMDHAIKALLLSLPSSSFIAQNCKVLNGAALLQARRTCELTIARKFENEWLQLYTQLHIANDTGVSNADFGRRRLKNLALGYLGLLPQHHALVLQQFSETKIMTDQQAALAILCQLPTNNPARMQAESAFLDQWKDDTLVMNKWFALQAASTAEDTFAQVQKLWEHPLFNKKNPNRVYALLRTFGDNLSQFHNGHGETYAYLADRIIELDKLNPAVAARISSAFNIWKKLAEPLKAKAHLELQRMSKAGLQKNAYEIITKALAE